MVEVEPGDHTSSTIWRIHKEVMDQRRDCASEWQLDIPSRGFELFGFGRHVECELGEGFEVGGADRAGCVVERRDGTYGCPYACLACVVLDNK